jgi:hypothetical protein
MKSRGSRLCYAVQEEHTARSSWWLRSLHREAATPVHLLERLCSRYDKKRHGIIYEETKVWRRPYVFGRNIIVGISLGVSDCSPCPACCDDDGGYDDLPSIWLSYPISKATGIVSSCSGGEKAARLHRSGCVVTLRDCC